MTPVATSDWPSHFPEKNRGATSLSSFTKALVVRSGCLGTGEGDQPRVGVREWDEGLVDMKVSNILRRSATSDRS